ncbi:hypothetical protein JKG47_22240, partial [Acidithiobacillus sp. MC6.1]|nr:hypothetical protein [Acidithiobacillus sp. MC6.1]
MRTPAINEEHRMTGPVLVLGAGGARGLAHIGVLKVLEAYGIRVSAVV